MCVCVCVFMRNGGTVFMAQCVLVCCRLYSAHLGSQITHMVASGDCLTIVENDMEIKRFNIKRQILTDSELSS